MKIGVCVGLPASVAGQTGAGQPAAGGAKQAPDMIALAAELGYDYIEMPLSPIAALDEARFKNLQNEMAKSKLKCECLNVFFPAKIRLTGGDVNERAIAEYVDLALSRAAAIGAEIVVFGSSGAKNVPDGFPYEDAFKQLVNAAGIISKAAVKHGVKIAIEPLNKKEANIILTVGEADKLMTAAGQPNIYILVDYYHFSLDSDSIDTLRWLTRERKIIHTHFAETVGRAYPREPKPEYSAVFDVLREEGYDARCSIEAGLSNPDDPRAEMEAGLACLRKITARDT